MFVKLEILMLFLRFPNAKFFIIDPENEYAPLVRAMGGEVVNISPISETHFNPLDFRLDKESEALPQVVKSDYVLSLFEKIMEKENVLPGDKSLIDHSLENIYKPLVDDRVALSRQLQQLIHENPNRLYLSLEGPIDVFSADETIPRSFAGCAPQIVAGTPSKAFVKVANPCGCSGFALPCDRLATGFVLLLPPGNEMLPAACVLARQLMQAAPRPEMFERYFLRREKFCEAFSV